MNRFLRLIFIILLLSLISIFSYDFLVEYSEKSGFIRYVIEEKAITNKNIDIYIAGDSQVMSGIHPAYLRNELKKQGKNYLINYSPKPSEQPEGVLSDLLELKKNNINIKKLIVNLSPLHLSKNPFTDSHRSLGINSRKFRLHYYTNSYLRNFYLKDSSDSFYYIIIQAFPLLKLNGNFSRELKIIPGSDGIAETNNLDMYLTRSFTGNLYYNRKLNQFLKQELKENEYYYEWGKKEKYSGECIHNNMEIKLPPGINAAFSNPRKNAGKVLLEIYSMSKTDSFELLFIEIPFSPEAEKALNNSGGSSPYAEGLKELKQNIPEESFLKIEPGTLKDSDYTDYIHPNSCGMKKITELLAAKISSK